MPVRTALRPGVLSATLPVPRSIAPPEYAWKSTVEEGSEAERSLLAVYRRGDRPVAVLGIDRPRPFTRIRKSL